MNNYDIEHLEKHKLYYPMPKKLKEELQIFAKFEPLLVEAKQYLRLHKVSDPKELLTHEKYKDLFQYDKFRKFIKNSKHYKKKKE